MLELLSLAKKFVDEWESDVAAFLSQDLESAVAIIDRVLLDKTPSDSDLCDLSRFLQQLVRLYFKLLQLRIKPAALKILRVWIWAISIFPYILTSMGYDFSMPAIPLPLMQHEQYVRALSLSDLNKIIATGSQMMADLTDVVMIHGGQVGTHKKTIVSILCALQGVASTGAAFISKCKECSTAAAALELQPTVAESSKFLVFDREFYYARLMNLLVVPKLADSEETQGNPAQEVYCWCRQGELLTSQMIMCDSCNDWFHYTCMGLQSKKAHGCAQMTGLSHSWCMLAANHDQRSFKKLKGEEEPFLCIRCSEEKGLAYAYAW